MAKKINKTSDEKMTICEICQQTMDADDVVKCDQCEEDGMCPDCLQEHKDETH